MVKTTAPMDDDVRFASVEPGGSTWDTHDEQDGPKHRHHARPL